MKKISNPAAYFTRLQQLAEVNKIGVKKPNNLGLGTLIDSKRTSDGIAYGIIKENHHYYIKKGGLKENLDVSDFTYIGGLENITEYQYNSLAEADKKRNMMLHVLNESVDMKTNVTKTKIVKEDVVDDKINSMEHSVSKLDNATANEKQAVAEPQPQIPDLTDDQPIPDGEESPEGEESLDIPDTEEAPEGGEDKQFEEIQSDLGKAVEKMGDKQLTKTQVKTVLNTIISAVKGDLAQFEVKEREELAEPIIKAEDVNGEADLETNMPDEEIEEGANDTQGIVNGINKINDLKKAKGEEPVDAQLLIDKYISNSDTEETDNVEEAKCTECNGFGMYSESRGYNKKSLFEANNDEKASLISGYINAFNEGKNNGDATAISILAKKAIVESLVSEYGHKTYVEKHLIPQMKTLNESTFKTRLKLLSEEFKIGTSGSATGTDNNDELKNTAKNVIDQVMKIKGMKPEKAQEMLKELMGASLNEDDISELFGGLKDKLGAIGDTVKSTVGAVKDKYNQNLATRQQATLDKKAEEDRLAKEKADAFQKSQLAGGRNVSIFLIQQHAQSLVDEIKTLNANRVERGLAELPASSLFRSMANQVATGSVDLSKSKKGWTDESKGLPTGTVEVQPNMLQEIEDDELDASINDKPETDTEEVIDMENPDDSAEEITFGEPEANTAEVGFAPDSANMGMEMPDHSGINIADVTVDAQNKTVNVKLNETKKPSAGLTKDEKSSVIKDAKAGKDIGKAGKGFEKVADKAAKEYGSEEAGKKVAAAAMWKGQAKKKADLNESDTTKKYIRAKLEELAGLRKPMLNESAKSETLKKLDVMIEAEYKNALKK